MRVCRIVFGTILLALPLDINSMERFPVRVLNWWDFTSSEVVSEMGKTGFEVDVDTYKSNGVAVAKLLQSRDLFHIAIVSNQVLGEMISSGLFLKDQFVRERESRNLLEFTKEYANHCLPYAWSVTAFAIIPQESHSPELSSLFDLIELSKLGYKTAIIDDQLEVFTRLREDFRHVCDNPLRRRSLPICDADTVINIDFRPSAKGFSSSVADILDRKGSAAYGWHGESKQAAEKYPDLRITLPSGRIVTGYDSVCILDNKKTRAKLNLLREFVIQLTSKRTAQLTAKYSQYFSPYEGDSVNLLPRFAALKTETERRSRQQAPIVIKSKSSESDGPIPDLKVWWRKLRYEK